MALAQTGLGGCVGHGGGSRYIYTHFYTDQDFLKLSTICKLKDIFLKNFDLGLDSSSIFGIP